ncbi:MAG: hypothetical protein PHV32_12130, partial [Eubacteriales bacterium]|nr:hypothetical protein [Eubacteriales bacterium]
MIILPLISSLLLIIAIVLLMGLTPERITDDIMSVISPKQSLRDKVRISQGKKKSRLTKALNHINEALIATGKGTQFAAICATSLALLIVGAMFAMLINNIFLVPIMATALALLPFVYAKSIIYYYDKHIEEEIETALSIITTSYIRSDDIVSAVKENLNYL